MIPDTEVSLSEGHVIASELGDDDDDAMVSSESTQPILSSPREGFQHNNRILQQPQKPNLIILITTTKSHNAAPIRIIMLNPLRELNPKLLQDYLSFIVRLINQSSHPSLLHRVELVFSSKSRLLEL